MTQQSTILTRLKDDRRLNEIGSTDLSREVADRIVNTCLRIGPEDVVVIDTVPHMVGLSTQIGVECTKRGAESELSLHTDDGFFTLIESGTTDQLARVSPIGLALAETMSVNIQLLSFDNPGRLLQVKPERMAALQRSRIPIEDVKLKRRIRTVSVGLSDITQKRAETYGLNLASWRKAMEAASAEDYAALAKFGTKVRELLKNGSEVRLRSSDGTDLRFNLAGRSPSLNDGIIDDEDMRTGAYSIVIPAGDVSVAVAEDSADGRFVSNVPQPWLGRMVEGIQWDFKEGKITKFEARKNISPVRSQYEASKGQKDRIGALTLGLNKRAICGQLFNLNHISSGVISVGIGNNKKLGGKNDSEFEFIANLQGGNLSIDGENIIKNGEFVKPTR